MNLKYAALAIAMIFASPSMAQQATVAKCISMEAFQAEIVKQDPSYKAIVLSGNALETFAAAMDKLSGGGHGPMDGLVFLDPEGNKNEVTMVAVFRDHCYLGNAPVSTALIKQALGQGI